MEILSSRIQPTFRIKKDQELRERGTQLAVTSPPRILPDPPIKYAELKYVLLFSWNLSGQLSFWSARVNYNDFVPKSSEMHIGKQF